MLDRLAHNQGVRPVVSLKGPIGGNVCNRRKAMGKPLGDQPGPTSGIVFQVSFRTPEPSGFMVKMSSSPSCDDVNAILASFGDH